MPCEWCVRVCVYVYMHMHECACGKENGVIITSKSVCGVTPGVKQCTTHANVLDCPKPCLPSAKEALEAQGLHPNPCFPELLPRLPIPQAESGRSLCSPTPQGPKLPRIPSGPLLASLLCPPDKVAPSVKWSCYVPPIDAAGTIEGRAV